MLMHVSIFFLFFVFQKRTLTMNAIMKGVLTSNHPILVKKRILQKIADSGGQSHPIKEICAVLELASNWILEENSDFIVSMAISIWKSWTHNNLSTFSEFFSQDFLLFLLSEKHNREENMAVLLKESFIALQHTSNFLSFVKVVELKCIAYIRDHQDIECVGNFADFLLKFTECIPQGEFATRFCCSLLYVLGASSVPVEKELFIKYFKLVQQIVELIVDIWKKTDSQTILECLKVVFDIISTVSDIDPSYCLGTLLKYIDIQMMDIALRSTILASKLGDDCLITALKRMVDWARWPMNKTVDVWVVNFLKGLASVQRYTVLMNITENKVTQVSPSNQQCRV